jgi:hypothetical protein
VPLLCLSQLENACAVLSALTRLRLSKCKFKNLKKEKEMGKGHPSPKIALRLPHF